MQPVKDNQQVLLRENGVMSNSEVAYVQGDLLVVVNVTTEEKRVLGKVNSFLNESTNRQLLKG